MKLNITDDALRSLRPDEGKAQLVAFDERLSGLGVVVGASATTFIVHKRVGGNVHRETLGRWKGRGGDLSVVDARKRARVIIGKLEGKETTPGQHKRASKAGPTLAEACELYLAHLAATDCRPSSIVSVRRELADRGDADHAGSYLKAWLDRPLASITAKECRARHDEIVQKHGPHVANRTMRNLRALWNFIAKEAVIGTIAGVPEGTMLPANPTIAVQWVAESSRSYFSVRRQEPIAVEALPAWRVAVDTLDGVRRDYNLVVIFTGLRRNDAASLRWEHINLTHEPAASRVWHTGRKKSESIELPPMSILRPSPKGGADRAFAIPISATCADVLKRRRDDNPRIGRDANGKLVDTSWREGDRGWVFPTKLRKGDTERREPCYLCRDLGIAAHVKGEVAHLMEPKEDGDALVSPHRLRDTYITTLGKLEPAVPETLQKLLVNHSLDKSDVTQGYMKIEIEPLRAPQQRVTDYLIEAMKPRDALTRSKCQPG
jgi:integrase